MHSVFCSKHKSGMKDKNKQTFCFLLRHSPHDVVVLSARDGLCCTASDMVRGPGGEGRCRRRASTVIGVGVMCVCVGMLGKGRCRPGCRADTYKEHRQGLSEVCMRGVGVGPVGN